MHTLIQIGVLLCVVVIEAQDTVTAYSELHEDNYSNRSRRQPALSAYTFPSKCNGAILSCCAETVIHQKKCFSNFRCAMTYNSGNACNKDTILKVLDSFVDRTDHDSKSQTRTKRWSYYNAQSNPRYPSKTEPDTNQPEQYLPHIVKLLEEIKTYVKTPQPSSFPHPSYHPIYVPFPIPYPVTQTTLGLTNQPTNVPTNVPTYVPTNRPTFRPSSDQLPSVTVNKVETIKVPNIDTRGSEIFLRPVQPSRTDDGDGARAITFVPIKPDKPLKRRAPKVEHGSVQADIRLPSLSSQASPVFVTNAPPRIVQSPCNAAILACCSEIDKQQSNCFYNFKCGIPYDNGNACKSDSIKSALSAFLAQ